MRGTGRKLGAYDMEHFYQDIDGMCDFEQFYKDIVANAESPARFVEIGVYKGRSAALMAVEIINSGKDIILDCVDPWDGRAEPGHGYSYHGHAYDEFLKRMLPVASVINAVKLPSIEAAERYDDDSLDFVFIDGTHTYDAVKQDIRAWLPKVKSGGLLTGHDYKHGAPFGPLVSVAVTELCPGHTVTNDHDPELSPVWIYKKP